MKRIMSVLLLCLFLMSAATSCNADYSRFDASKEEAVNALSDALSAMDDRVYVYRDFSDTENHFTQRAKM